MNDVQKIAKIDDLIAFNHQLTNLNNAGLPIDLGDGTAPELLASQLQHIVSLIAVQVSRGVSVDEALENAEEVPASYRAAWTTWFHGGNSVESIQSLTRQAMTEQEIRTNVSYALLHPFVIFLMVFLAFIYIVTVAATHLERTYAQIPQPPGFSLLLLLTARRWLFLWGPLVPLLSLLAVLYWRKHSRQWKFHWLPGRKRFDQWIRRAHYADNMAQLLESNQSLDAALKKLGPSSLGTKMPPLLSWAMNCNAADEDGLVRRARLLRFVANSYHSSAQREVNRWRTWLPTVASVTIGGALVLLYAVSLFAPMIELITTLTAP